MFGLLLSSVDSRTNVGTILSSVDSRTNVGTIAVFSE